MRTIPREAVLLCLLFAPLAQGASAPASSGREAAVDEVVVEATRAKLDEMRQELVKLEDRFNARYNELNLNNDFDVHCREETRTGTVLRRRYCRAVYQAKALDVEATEYLLYLQRSNPTPGDDPQRPWPVIGGPPPPAVMVIEGRRKEFQKNMRDVVGQNPDLIALLRERAELAKRYEVTRRKLFNLKPLPEEQVAPPATRVPP